MNKFNPFGKADKKDVDDESTPHQSGAASPVAATGGFDVEKEGMDREPVRLMRPYIFAMTMIVSLGGMIFGYDTGQISGFLEMRNFLFRFHSSFTDPDDVSTYKFSNARSGTIVGLLSIGTLFGALLSKPVADQFGRRVCIVFWNLMFCVGVIIQIATSDKWYQIALGRWVAGLGVGGLSVLTPMYQSETAPRQIRGTMVSTYQLFITLGILVANLINLGTNKIGENPGNTGPGKAAQWQIPMGIGFIWPALMIAGICMLPESPRWDYRHGNVERARRTIARSYGVSERHWEVHREMREIKEKFDAENVNGGKHQWYEVVTGPRMGYRTLLGVTLQALQQLTGANFFFYYGTVVFNSIGLSDSYVTSTIFAAINFGMTFPGLWVVEQIGRRRALMWGAAWMFMCFMVFSSVGHFLLQPAKDANSTNHPAGVTMIVFASLFIAGYAMTWGPIIWVVVGEMFPTRYRAMAMGISSASNWIWNFLISFFTPFITGAIDFRYGYIFAGCTGAAVPIVYFFLMEHQGRTLEEIDTMYITHVKPWESSKWQAPEGEELVTADKLFLDDGARNISKQDATGQRVENTVTDAEKRGVHDVSGTGFEPVASGARGGSIS